MTIYSCRYCVAPKRHPGCHDRCPEYLREKAQYEERKEAVNKERAISIGLESQKAQGVYKAMKRRRKGL